MVSTLLSEEDSEDKLSSQELDSETQKRQDTCSPMDSANSECSMQVIKFFFQKKRVYNVSFCESFKKKGELNVLLMQNRKFGAEIASSVSAGKRVKIIERAKQLDIKILNPKGRTRKVESE